MSYGDDYSVLDQFDSGPYSSTPEVPITNYSDGYDLGALIASSGFDSSSNYTPPMQSASSGSLLSSLSSFAGTIQDFGSSIINLDSSFTNTQLKAQQQQLMATTQQQQLAIQAAKQTQAYNLALRNTTPIAGTNTTPNQLFILAIIVVGVFMVAHH